MQLHTFPSHENKKVEKLLEQLALKKAAARSQDDLKPAEDSRTRLSGEGKFRGASTPPSL